jgi:hypothetical protein
LPQQQQHHNHQQQQQQWPQQPTPRQQAGREQPTAAHPQHTQAVQAPSNGNGRHSSAGVSASALPAVTAEPGSTSSSSSVRSSRQGAGGRAALARFISSCIKQCSTPQQVRYSSCDQPKVQAGSAVACSQPCATPHSCLEVWCEPC